MTWRPGIIRINGCPAKRIHIAWRGFASVLVALSCTEAVERSPAPDHEYQSRTVWKAGADVPQLSLRSKTTYCPSGSSRSDCWALDNGTPKDAFVTTNGHVVFFDHKAGLVEMDSAGHHVADLGGLGTDPGSYRRVTSLGGSAARTFTMWDPFLDRLTVIKPGQKPRTAWVKDPRVEAVLAADTFAVALSVPAAEAPGVRVLATIASILPNGKLSSSIATVVALATTRKKREIQAIPSFFWPRPIWSLGQDGSVTYVPPDTSLRIEVYDSAGHPKLLVTGELPFPGEPVTQREIRERQESFYQTVMHEPMLPAGSCNLTVQSTDTLDSNIQCATARFLDAVGKRSPRLHPPITDVVSLAPQGFWVKTSRIRGDSATWLVADSTGKLVGLVMLKVAERPIGRHRALIAIADSTDGRTSVSWREVIQ